MVIVEEDMPEASSTPAPAGLQQGIASSSSSSAAAAVEGTEAPVAAASQGEGQQADKTPASNINLVSIRVPGT
jgi:hypothetical protein